MQSIKNFLFPGWKKLLKVFVLFLIITPITKFLLAEPGYSEIVSIISGIILFSLVMPAAFLVYDVFGLEPSLINLLIPIAIYWYLLACLIIFICENKKISNAYKLTIITAPIIFILVFIITVMILDKSEYDPNYDGKIMGNMNQIRSEAQIVELEDNNFAGICADNDIIDLIIDIDKNAPSPASCFSEKAAYCVTVELNSGDFYCVDSALRSISTAATSCTAENKSCK